MNDLNGNISTCNSTNLFFIQDNEVFTSSGQYCLNGITRSKIIEVCKENSIKCYQQDFDFEFIKNCSEAFVTGTFAGVVPVSKIEYREIKSTQSNSLSNRVRKLYNSKIKEYIKR